MLLDAQSLNVVDICPFAELPPDLNGVRGAAERRRHSLRRTGHWGEKEKEEFHFKSLSYISNISSYVFVCSSQCHFVKDVLSFKIFKIKGY